MIIHTQVSIKKFILHLEILPKYYESNYEISWLFRNMQVLLSGRLSLEMQGHTWSRHPLIFHFCALFVTVVSEQERVHMGGVNCAGTS